MLKIIGVAVEKFGSEVFECLQNAIPEASWEVFMTSRLDALEYISISDAHILISVSPHPAPMIYKLLYERGRSALALVTAHLDRDSLYVGPLKLSRNLCCWNCYATKKALHSPWTDEELEILRFYCGLAVPKPMLISLMDVQLAAGSIKRIIDMVIAGSAEAGTIWEIDLLSHTVTTEKVFGLHGCEVCDQGRIRDPRRKAESLQNEMINLGVFESGTNA